MEPVQYQMTFMCDDYPGRKESFNVMAMDVIEAIETAKKIERHGGRLVVAGEARPRWMQSDAANSPDMLSEAVVRFYAAKLGLSVLGGDTP